MHVHSEALRVHLDLYACGWREHAVEDRDREFEFGAVVTFKASEMYEKIIRAQGRRKDRSAEQLQERQRYAG